MKITEIKDWLQVLAIVIGAGWAIWTFGLKTEREDIVYRGKSVAAVPSCSLNLVGHSRGFYVVRAQSSVRSTSKIKVHVFHSPYKFAGTFAAPLEKVAPYKEFISEVNEKMKASEQFAHAQQYGLPNNVSIEMGRLWSTATYLEPNERIDDERLFLVSDKNAATFDWVTFSFALVLAEDTSRLGLKVEFDSLGNLSGEYRVYDKAKKNPFDFEGEAGSKYKAIAVKSDGVSQDTAEAQLVNVGVTSVRCNIILPPKELTVSKRQGETNLR